MCAECVLSNRFFTTATVETAATTTTTKTNRRTGNLCNRAILDGIYLYDKPTNTHL